MIIIKIFGVILVVTSSSVIGFLKSRSLVERHKKLLLLSDAVNMLYNYIEQSGFELDLLIKNAFAKCDFLTFDQNEILCNDSDLKKDKSLIEEFFVSLGNSTKKVECDHINHFVLKLKTALVDAKNDVAQKSKVYQTLGICVGLTMGILFV